MPFLRHNQFSVSLERPKHYLTRQSIFDFTRIRIRSYQILKNVWNKRRRMRFKIIKNQMQNDIVRLARYILLAPCGFRRYIVFFSLFPSTGSASRKKF